MAGEEGRAGQEDWLIGVVLDSTKRKLDPIHENMNPSKIKCYTVLVNYRNLGNFRL